ncbi:MAG: hypothetical protein P8R42_16445 [Candidatus Binatia bacterium]|nr:hypothetical protein [Candidatus Binatia bacterium]
MAEDEIDEEPSVPLAIQVRAMAREAVAATRYLLLGRRPGLDLEEVARGGAFFPVLGLLLGALAVVLVRGLEGVVGTDDTALVAVLVLTGLTTATLPRGLAGTVALAFSPRASIETGESPMAARAAGVAAAGATTWVKWWALSVTPPEALSLSLPLALMLGRWAFVVQAYGSRSARADGVGAVFPRAMQFREFGIASVSSMALTLILANAIGLILILWTATQTITLRILVHRRAGGVGERSLAAGAELAEVSTLLLCAGLARAILAG